MFIAGDESPEVLQPCEEPLDLPPAAIAAERTTVLGLAPIRAVGGDEFDAALGEPRVEPIAVVGAVPDQALRERAEEALLQGLFDEGDFGRASTCDINGERKTSAVCNCHDLGALALTSIADEEAPFFAPAKVASMKPSVRSIPPWAARSRAKVSSIVRSAPLFTHSWNRR